MNKPLIIRDLVAKVPIVLGGMGVGVTGSKLAAAVAKQGGIGVLSGVNIGYKESDFNTNWLEANLRVLKKEIIEAKNNSLDGVIGVNFMVAMNSYAEHVKVAIDAGVDIIISGAGLPLDLPKLVEGTKTKIAPIVSSGKAAKVITKKWVKTYGKIPDAIVLEGIKAGGHLGFKKDDIDKDDFNIVNTLKDIQKVLKPYEEEFDYHIPIIVGGGVYTKEDMDNLLKEGADAVQMSTRFVATYECDAADEFKQSYIEAEPEDVSIIISPVGMPGRAINNKFVQNLAKGIKPKIEKCNNCLSKCSPATTPYCISKALINSVKGNVENGLIFAGSNVSKVKKMMSVEEIFDELKD